MNDTEEKFSKCPECGFFTAHTVKCSKREQLSSRSREIAEKGLKLLTAIWGIDTYDEREIKIAGEALEAEYQRGQKDQLKAELERERWRGI